LRLWAITDAGRDLGKKVPYDPELAQQSVEAHARHFLDLIRSTAAGASADGPAVICSPYDAELFGHWWFEGPAWLEQVSRGFAKAGVTPVTLGEALEAVPPRGTVALPEGSWGEGGDHRVWLNAETEWTWDRIYSAEDEWVTLLGRLETGGADFRRVVAQASRELLLLQASDWQFLITTAAARDYAERRLAEHYAEFKSLAELARTLADGNPLTVEAAGMLRRLEREDFCFPELDPAWGRGAAGGR
jgi:1,4-alpha-glucan branching enzyme